MNGTAAGAVGRRGAFTGMLQILRFNWTQYAAAGGLFIGALAVAALAPLPEWVRWAIMAAAGPGLFWTVGSLLVSHLVYDRSRLGRWDWIRDLLPAPPARWANLHAGLDESSDRLLQLFPGTEYAVWDMFDPELMTEPSIRRARRLAPPNLPARPVRHDRLPAETETLDAVFVIFAAHELRTGEQRRALFGELGRVLAPRGRVVLVEHLRDRPNFLAFGPGFLHFFSRAQWLDAARSAGLRPATEARITPFVGVFVLEREP